jgi:hypothetical protein
MARSLLTFPIRLGLRGASMAVDGAATVAGHALGIAGRLAEVLTKNGEPDLDIDGREHEPEERSRPAADKPRRQRRPKPAPVRPAEAASPQPGRPEAESEPTAASESEPTAASESEPTAASESEPTAASESEPTAASESEATAASEVLAPEPEPSPVEDATPSHVSAEPVLVDEVAEAGAQDGAGAEVRVDEPWESYRELGADDVIDRINGASTAVLAAVQLYEQSHRRRKTVLEAVERQLRQSGS